MVSRSYTELIWLVKQRGTLEEWAATLHIATSTLENKLAGRSEFKASEMEATFDWLGDMVAGVTWEELFASTDYLSRKGLTR